MQKKNHLRLSSKKYRLPSFNVLSLALKVKTKNCRLGLILSEISQLGNKDKVL